MTTYQRIKIEGGWLRYSFVFLLIFILAIAAFFSPLVLADSTEIVDYGTDCVTCGKIGGIVWNDVNWNGRQDSNEGGIAGTMLRLWMLEDGKYQIYRAQTTGRSGVYIFDNLLAGSYRIEVVEPYSPGLQNCVQTTHRSPTPVIELQPQEFLRYDFSYTGENSTISVNAPAWPAMYSKSVNAPVWPGTYSQLDLPAVFLNSRNPGELDSQDNQSSPVVTPDPGLPPLPEPTPIPPGPTPPRPGGPPPRPVVP